MSDQFISTEEPIVPAEEPAVTAIPVPEEAALLDVESEEDEDSATDNNDELFQTPVVLPPSAQVVTLRATTGDSKYVPVEGPTRLSTVVAMSGLIVQGQMAYYIEGVQVDPSVTVAPGTAVTLVGAVKGG